MSEYQEFLEEKHRIDTYLQNDYEIQHITENISGMFIKLQSPQSNGIITLHIKTPNGRKYISTILMYDKFISSF